MAQPDGSRRQYLLLRALQPDKTMGEVQISYARMQAVGRRSMGHAKECGLIVPAILQQPTAIFEGLRRDEDEDPRGFGWRCYCGIPAHSYSAEGSEGRPYAGQVYLVFVNDERVVYNWRWERVDPDDPSLPIDYQTRFRRRLL